MLLTLIIAILRNARLFLNNLQYPYEQLNLNYETNNCAMAYKIFKNFINPYYGTDDGQVLNDYKNKCGWCLGVVGI